MEVYTAARLGDQQLNTSAGGDGLVPIAQWPCCVQDAAGCEWRAVGSSFSPERFKLMVQAGRKANPVQCLLFSLYFSFTKKWVGQLEKNPKTWDDLQSICFLGGEMGSSALQNVVFVFPARPLPILVVNVCGATLCCAEVCEFPEGS